MPLKRIKRAFKKVTKPIAKVLDKVVPNEIKPFLPYAAAVAPFMLPAGGIGSLPFASNPALQRAILSWINAIRITISPRRIRRRL